MLTQGPRNYLIAGSCGRYEWKLSPVETSPDFSYQRYAGFTVCVVPSGGLQNFIHGNIQKSLKYC